MKDDLKKAMDLIEQLLLVTELNMDNLENHTLDVLIKVSDFQHYIAKKYEV